MFKLLVSVVAPVNTLYKGGLCKPNVQINFVQTDPVCCPPTSPGKE